MLLSLANANAATSVSRGFDLVFQKPGTATTPSSTVRISTVVMSPVNNPGVVKVASFNDALGNVYVVSNSATYDDTQKTFVNTFTITSTPPGGQNAQKVADVQLQCALEAGQTSCRATVTNPGLNIEVQSAVADLANDQSSLVDLTLDSSKVLATNDGTQVKVLEKAQLSTELESGKDTLLYSDSQTKSQLSANYKQDGSGNIGINYTGKDGSIYLAGESGMRATIELDATLPGAPATFKRNIEMEPVSGTANVPASPFKGSALQGIFSENVNATLEKINYNARLIYDATGLKPDTSQNGYTSGSGLLVESVAAQAGQPDIKAYWDVDTETADDAARNSVRTNSFKVIVGGVERNIKTRTSSGQRVAFSFADTSDLTKNDISSLEIQWNFTQ